MSRADVRTPTGIAVGLGAGFLLVAAVLGATVPANDPGLRVAPMVIAVALTGALTGDRLAAAGIAVTAMLVVNGFLVNEDGQLSWHGRADLWRIGALAVACAVGLVLAAARHGRREAGREPVRRAAAQTREQGEQRRSITANPR
jgi:hypothetical protein